MPQSIKQSAAEAVTNTVGSFLIAWVMYFTLIPWMFNVQINPLQSIGMVAVFSIVSLVRQFILRRVFNKLEKRGVAVNV